MITSTQNRATIGKVIALGFLLATLLTTVLSIAPAGAAVPSGKAFTWGYNENGQLGNGASGAGADSDVPVSVKNLTGVTNIDSGYGFTLAATQ